MARPNIQMDLLDSNHKKYAFLKQATAELGLKSWEERRWLDVPALSV